MSAGVGGYVVVISGAPPWRSGCYTVSVMDDDTAPECEGNCVEYAEFVVAAYKNADPSLQTLVDDWVAGGFAGQPHVEDEVLGWLVQTKLWFIEDARGSELVEEEWREIGAEVEAGLCGCRARIVEGEWTMLEYRAFLRQEYDVLSAAPNN